MKLSEKIIKLRRAAGMSQEELADRLGISRQAVSKWESEQSVPDIDKIILLSELFGVTTDYLLKDTEVQNSADRISDSILNDVFEDASEKSEAAPAPAPCATLSDTKEYFAYKKREARIIAIAVMLFILSPILILTLPTLAELGFMKESLAVVLGLAALFSFIALGVGLCIYSDMLSKSVTVCTNKDCEFDFASVEYAKSERLRHSRFYTVSLIIGIALCILSPVPVIAAGITGFTEVPFMVALLLCLVAVGVALIVNMGTVEEGEERILNGSKKYKGISRAQKAVTDCYWAIIVFTYLLVSFLTSRWDITWVIWPLSGVFSNLIPLFFRKKK